MRRIPIFIGLFALLCYSTSCESKKHENKDETKYLVSSPIRKDTSITKDYVCLIHSIRHIELRALEKGYLQHIYVDEGQSVTKGQKMFYIMPNVYQADLQKAKAEAEVAEIQYKNTQLLADGNVVSANELAMAKAEFDRAKAEVSLAETHLGFTDIRAPFDGIMDHLEAREGSLLDEGELLTTLSDNSKMWVYFNVPESEYLDYITSANKGSKQKVELLMANNKKFNQPGIVETIEGEFNNQTGNIAFRATFPNPDGILRHGETGSVLMTVPLKNAMLIPQKATFEVLDKKYVFVLDKDDKVQQREIVVGAELPHLFVVEKGLSEDDKVLLEGIRMVRNGEKIHYEFEKPEAILANLELYTE
ncbi:MULTISPECIES: efflux RND transporter periplasmic adaptor subunit [Flagellimonas]|uniref:Efflux RND transporter periplasmic adaptor subunit n=2 Tax=Flagellimonas TaxID=444459 RepID=A0A3A1NGL8_9FLAO|nr:MULTISPECIES: efflux RND transporter periplasmic adaptor subunit [Allomuricauda]RIV42111.1 efflux RND transporter periplasmic adaptor subunit [Allomuricauda maritima]RIV68411.1 efflux RND transporter periplasmic adaptor subunit [Allomuricauda aequoris]TXJ90999.1 efflux RND transporter periplasmic adaptor subunit [Allomuricauda maritima]TXK00105.1 efflux RND transporter periplasmic adaptor subunit [Allomuricauda aequoris]